MPRLTPDLPDDGDAEWHRRVVGRSLRTATRRLSQSATVMVGRVNVSCVRT